MSDGEPQAIISYDYVFGFGSIMDTSTHATWQTSESSAPMLGSVVTISKNFGYQRQWNFRSSTGFTALGVSKAERTGESCDINGVLFQVPTDEMPNFDRRETGYERIAIPLQMMKFHPEIAGHHFQAQFQLTPADRIWIYVPLASHTMYADENHPLLQSYVDTVLRGCLEWGGEAMAEQFILTTGGWGTYFLNDTPSSRRPWLFRKEYNTIDALLKKHSEKTHYGDRRHPEEFAASFNQKMRGTWSIPRRNPNFTGRDHEIGQLHSLFMSQDIGRKAVITVKVVGMGGVGKSQLTTEYCYRYFPIVYGLIVWVNCETSDSLVADYRQLLADLAYDNSDAKAYEAGINKSADDVLSEVKARLFRSHIPWLLVLDNLEDQSLLEKCIPHGAGTLGHVLITSRHVDAETGSERMGSLMLGCFTRNESLELLRRSVGAHNIESTEDEDSAKELSDRLGNLPLALGIAGAYMRKCDVRVSEYLERYTDQSMLHGKLNAVTSSLSLSLKEAEKISPVACEVLKLLSFLGPDQITKALIRHLLKAKTIFDNEQLNEQRKMKRAAYLSAFLCTLVAGGAAIIFKERKGTRGLMMAFTSLTAISLLVSQKGTLQDMNECSNAFYSSEYEQSDVAWNTLKSFSLLQVKEGKGNVHRLLQESMRSCQDKAEMIRNITVCIEAMNDMWSFKASQSESWKDSLLILEHVKSAVSQCLDNNLDTNHTLQAAHLSKEVAVFSAMTLNAFSDAKISLDFSLKLYDNTSSANLPQIEIVRAIALHELGRVYRYQGLYSDSKTSLTHALDILGTLNQRTPEVMKGIADTLHEMGLLELKQHNILDAETHLNNSLALRRKNLHLNDMNAECASTLHQLAAVNLARKPPALDTAKALLLESLRLCSQIGQRAATLKQLARVTIRQGLLDLAENYLEQALDLYVELYGDNRLHMNIAAVKFQQGALAMQRECFEDAWLHYYECLRIRRHVYAYARSLKDKNPIHVDVSCVLHELGCVRFAQGNYVQSKEMFSSEQDILIKLEEAQTTSDRIHQARLTNLTWLKKCAKELGNENDVTVLSDERSQIKKCNLRKLPNVKDHTSIPSALEQEAMHCRLLARKFALEKDAVGVCDELATSLNHLLNCSNDLDEEMKQSALQFRNEILAQIRYNASGTENRRAILQACDVLRDVLRARGLKVDDSRIVRITPGLFGVMGQSGKGRKRSF